VPRVPHRPPACALRLRRGAGTCSASWLTSP